MNTDNDEDWTIFGDNCPCCGGETDWEYTDNDNIRLVAHCVPWDLSTVRNSNWNLSRRARGWGPRFIPSGACSGKYWITGGAHIFSGMEMVMDWSWRNFQKSDYKRIHNDCEGEVWMTADRLICRQCGAQEFIPQSSDVGKTLNEEIFFDDEQAYIQSLLESERCASCHHLESLHNSHCCRWCYIGDCPCDA